MNPFAIIGILTAIAQAAPDVAAAIQAVVKMLQDQALSATDMQAIGQAAIDAHTRLQAPAPVAPAAPVA